MLLLGAVGYGAMPQSPKPPLSGDLQQQVMALERRTQQLEERIASLEHARAAGDAKAKTAPADDKPLTITAPFTVVDRNHKVVRRVQDAGESGLARGVDVFQADVEQPMAHLGILDGGGGRVYPTNPATYRPAVQISAPESTCGSRHRAAPSCC